ncbi:hypothetical protein J7E62_00220 [Variovorax paradoxus]|nr:hypothetical protein [Variovorax paradoxus]
MNTSLTAAAAGLLSLAFALQAAAAEAKSNPAAAEFTKMDANHDHLVSANEHAAGARQMFEAMDANKDGKVTADEMQAAAQRVTGHKAKVSDMSAAAHRTVPRILPMRRSRPSSYPPGMRGRRVLREERARRGAAVLSACPRTGRQIRTRASFGAVACSAQVCGQR